jgi:hypothetical protein
MRSATLSGWPSPTDSEVKRYSPFKRIVRVLLGPLRRDRGVWRKLGGKARRGGGF